MSRAVLTELFVTALAIGVMVLSMAIAVVLLFASATAQAAEAATPVDPMQSTASRLFDALDTNRDQALTRREFQSGYDGLQRLMAMQARLRGQFDALDADRSRAIEAREYPGLELIRRKGKEAPPLADFDTNHDRALDFAEYLALVRRLAPATTPAAAKQ